MSRTVRFVVALVAGLALLAAAASLGVNATIRGWFERDVAMRARLVVSGSRHALVPLWRDGRAAQVGTLLAEITRDERIMGAAACGADGALLAAAGNYPPEFSCDALSTQLKMMERSGELASPAAGPAGAVAAEGGAWTSVARFSGGRIHVSAIPIRDGARPLGFIVLVHDLSFVETREAKIRGFLFVTFGVLAAAAAVITIVAARLAWRGWNRELQRSLEGEIRGESNGQRPEFLPILRDVRELVDRITAEAESERQSGVWTPQRLKQTLHRFLRGEKVVILANREPYIHEPDGAGGVKVLLPASGLVTALEPVMRACSGVWVAHGSGGADRQTADENGRVRVPPDHPEYVVRRVWLSAQEERGYYYGFANEGLWPLCHNAHQRPIFRTEDWDYYRLVNQRFADAVCAEVDSADPIILVQDYHFALAPRLIRAKLPGATIISFWHIPWPSTERFGICPWQQEILEGMLGSSILGFHTQLDCNNFVDSVERFLEARVDKEQSAVVYQGGRTMVRAYPISVEWPSRWVQAAPPVAQCRAEVLRELGLPSTALVGLGVDRLDYTKGVEERLLAVERLLERHAEFRGRFTFVQLGAPSRTVIPRYRELNEAIEQLAARINQKFGVPAAGADAGYRPIILKREHHEPPEIFRYYRAADLCYVSSLHDGMNLVSKEFVSAREDERGVLVLSHFTGAARELTEALIVNPYDLDEAAAALKTALVMSPAEQQDRMRSLRAFVAEFNVYRWAGRMLVDAARLRRHERITGRLTARATNGGGAVV